jgi:hypothetical protein
VAVLLVANGGFVRFDVTINDQSGVRLLDERDELSGEKQNSLEGKPPWAYFEDLLWVCAKQI